AQGSAARRLRGLRHYSRHRSLVLARRGRLRPAGLRPLHDRRSAGLRSAPAIRLRPAIRAAAAGATGGPAVAAALQSADATGTASAHLSRQTLRRQAGVAGPGAGARAEIGTPDPDVAGVVGA